MGLVLRSGIWYLRIKHAGRSVWRSLGVRRRPGPADAAAAEAELWREIGRPQQGVAVGPDTAAGGAVGEFLAWVLANRSRPYYERCHDVLALALSRLPAELEAWKPKAVEAHLLKARAESDWSARTYNLHRQTILRLLSWHAWRNDAPEPARRKLEKAREKRPAIKFHTMEQLGQVFAACDAWAAANARARWLPMAARLAYGTGLRASDLAALTWDGVDLRRGRLAVPPGKNSEGREIPLSQVAREALEKFRGRREGLIFPDFRIGHPPLERAVRAAGLPKVGWHHFKHDFVSHLLLAGVQLHVVKELAAHKSITTTMRYAHLSSQDLDRGAARLPAPPPAQAQAQAPEASPDPKTGSRGSRKTGRGSSRHPKTPNI